jgi:hypothetical protein
VVEHAPPGQREHVAHEGDVLVGEVKLRQVVEIILGVLAVPARDFVRACRGLVDPASRQDARRSHEHVGRIGGRYTGELGQLADRVGHVFPVLPCRNPHENRPPGDDDHREQLQLRARAREEELTEKDHNHDVDEE